MNHGVRNAGESAYGFPCDIRHATEQSKDYIFVIDSNSTVRYINAFATNYLRRPPRKIVEKHLEDLFPENFYAVKFHDNKCRISLL
jgi:PAS domain-containing protein